MTWLFIAPGPTTFLFGAALLVPIALMQLQADYGTQAAKPGVIAARPFVCAGRRACASLRLWLQ